MPITTIAELPFARYCRTCLLAAVGTFATPPLHAQPDPPTAAAEGAASELFDVWEYRVLGSEVLDRKVVERALYTHLGTAKTIEDVELARKALEDAYRAAGYSTVFVDIPEQTVDAGIVRLNATEGRLDRLRVSGSRYFSNRRILAALPALKSGEVPRFPDVQQQLADLNQQTADRSVTPVLRAGRSPGTVDLELRVADELPLHGSVEVNDRYTVGTTELRTSLSLSYDNLWQRNHTASLQYQSAPQEPDEATVLAATYIARLARARTILALYAVDSSSDVATFSTLSVLGQGNIFGIRGIRPLDSLGPYFHNVTFGIDFKDFDENILLTPTDGQATAIKYTNWSANYAFGWQLPRSRSDFSAGAAWGMRGWGNDDAEFEEKRFKARANYVYFTGSAQHSRDVFGEARFVSRLAWQYTNAPLISNEQFSAGGATTVRGYPEAEQLGDYGANVSLELYSPSLVNGANIEELRLFGFIDAASLGLEDPLPDQVSRSRLRSAGAGLRFLGFNGFTAELDWARPLVDGANVMADDDRWHFRLNYGF